MSPSAGSVDVPIRADVTIPDGPASKLGKLATAALAVIALVTAAAHGDHTPETLVALGGAVITLATYMGGKYAQAAALLRDAPSPVAATRSAP